MDDGGHETTVRESTLRDMLVFGLESNNLRRDAIALGNTLTFKQVCDLAKAEESAKTLMKIITPGEYKLASLHVVYDQRESTESKQKLPTKKSRRLQFKSKGCFTCGNIHDKSTICPPKIQNASTVARLGTMRKCV